MLMLNSVSLSSAPDDYTASVSGEYTLSAGMSEQAVMIPLENDSMHEFLESFSVAIGLSCNHSGVLLGQSLATVLVTDDDSKCMCKSSLSPLFVTWAASVTVNLFLLIL